MERCKDELKISYEKCRAEESNIVNLLDNLMQKQKQLLDQIDLFDSEEIINKRNIILEATHINYMLFNKLLSVNVELESCSCRLNNYSSQGILDLYESINQIPSTLVSIQANSFPNDVFHDDASKLSNNFQNNEVTIKVNQRENQNDVPCIDQNKDSDDETEGRYDNVAISNIEQTKDEQSLDLDINSSSIVPATKSLDVEDNEEKVALQISNISIIDDDESEKSSDSNLVPITKNIDDEGTNKTNAPVSRAIVKTYTPQISSTESEKSSGSNNVQKDQKKAVLHDNSVAKKFELHQPKGRFERRYEHIKTPMPDLSFSRDNDSSSEYYSLPDKDGSYKNVEKIKNGSVNSEKPLVKSNMKKKSATENFPVIKDHELPNAKDICIITYLSDPSEFYITLIGDDIIISLNEQLKEFAHLRRSNFRTKLDAKLAMGEFCIAYSAEFESWNRAQILDWHMTDSEFVDIQYVDFGEYATVKFHLMFPIPECFCYYPKQAIRCHLANAISVYDDTLWPAEAIKDFDTLCYNRGEYQHFKIVCLAQERNSLSIDLMKENGNDVTLCEMMIIFGHVKDQDSDSDSRKFMTEQIKASQGLSGTLDTGDPSKELDAFCNDLPETHATIADAMMGYNAQDDRRICKFTRRDGTCFKGPRCRLEHKQKRKDGVTVDTEEVFVTPDHSFMPSVNEQLDVVITYFRSPGIVYGQVKLAENGYGKIVKDMFKAMNTKETIQQYEKFKMNPAIDELVIAKNSDDRWYRGRVLELTSTQWSKEPIVKVFFIDFGDMADVRLDSVRKMIAGFASHPVQAIQFELSNIRPTRDLDWVQFKEFIKQHLNNKFTVTVTYAGSDFIDGFFKDNLEHDLGQQMINNGFAEPNTDDFHPLRSSNILVD